ncbi:MAG: 5-methyltetrahydropteroyltriglutamate--homocysteine methyltransferase, partial [Flavobacteriaceae bacterium]
MKISSDSILTTHVGSLPRPKDVTDLVFAKEKEEPVDETEFNRVIERSVNDTLAKQKKAG